MIVNNSPHYNAFTKLKPIPTDAEDAAVALELDRVLAIYNEDYKEIFPTTTVKKINEWENIYELSHDGELEARRQALLAAINKDSGIAERHYIALAASLGFAIQITKPPRMLRAGLGRAGFPVYDANEQYTWTVYCYSSEEDAVNLIQVLESQKIPFTVISLVFTEIGAIYDEETGLPICDEETGFPIIDEEFKN